MYAKTRKSVSLRKLINMNFIRLLPVIFNLLILSAHFSRLDLPILTLLLLLLPLILFIKKRWVANFVRILLVLGSIEWIRSMFKYVFERQSIGEPYIRLVLILGIVALFTGLSALIFRTQSLKILYKL